MNMNIGPLNDDQHDDTRRFLHEERAKRHRGTRSERSPHGARTSERAERGRAVDRRLVRDRDRGREGGRVLAVDVRDRVRRVRARVRALDLDGLDEHVEVTRRLVIGVVPVDDATSPLNSALARGVSAGRPDTRQGVSLIDPQ